MNTSYYFTQESYFNSVHEIDLGNFSFIVRTVVEVLIIIVIFNSFLQVFTLFRDVGVV